MLEDQIHRSYCEICFLYKARKYTPMALGAVKGILLSTLFVFGNYTASAQTYELDQHNLEKLHFFTYKNPDSILHYAERLKRSKNYCTRLKAKLFDSKAHYDKKDFRTSRNIASKVIEEISAARTDSCNFTKLKFTHGNTCKECLAYTWFGAYTRLFYTSKNLKEYEKALDYLIELKRALENLPIKNLFYYKSKIGTDLSHALLKIELGNYKEAINVLKEAERQIGSIIVAMNDSIFFVRKHLTLQETSLNNAIGDAYLGLHDESRIESYIDSASLYYKKAYNVSITFPHLDSESFYQMRNIDVLVRKEDHELALFNLNRYDSIFSSMPTHTATAYYYRAIIHRHLKNYDSAIHFSKKSLKHHKISDLHNNHLISTYDNLANSYLAIGVSDSALRYSNLTLNKVKELEKRKQRAGIKFHSLTLEEIEQLNSALKKARKDSRSTKYILALLLFASILASFVYTRRIPSSKDRKRNIDGKKASKILEDLTKFEKTTLYLDDAFDIKTLADHLDTNTTYLSIVINDHKKQTFKQYLSNLRINYVMSKLKHDKKFSKYSIEGIAKEVGYKNASAFTRAFKNHTGVTPSKYIRHNSKKGVQ